MWHRRKRALTYGPEVLTTAGWQVSLYQSSGRLNRTLEADFLLSPVGQEVADMVTNSPSLPETIGVKALKGLQP